MPPKILVVDDDTEVRLVLGLQLRSEGWTVREAANADEAMARLREEPFDAIVLDLRMPGAWGFTFVREYRAAGYDVPTVVFSAFHGPEVEDEAEELGLPLFQKPDTAGMLAAVRAAVEPAGDSGRRGRRRRP